MPTLLATNSSGVSRATLVGDTWSVERIATPSRVYTLAADPLAKNVVFAGTRSGVFRSEDAGRTWVPTGVGPMDVRAMAASPARQGLVFAGTRPCALFVSRDGGASWTELPSLRAIARRRAFFSPAEWPPIPYVSAIALSAGDANRIVVGFEVGGVVVSADGGATWRAGRGAIYDCHSLVAHARDPMRFYQGGAGFNKAGRTSTDGGATWTGPRSENGLAYGWASVGDPDDADTWYYSVSSGPSKAHNRNRAAAVLQRVRRGRSERVGLGTNGLPVALANMPYQLLFAERVFYAGLANGEIWQSANRGETWSVLPVNLAAVERSFVVL